jgi:hypothetical protein
MRYDNSPQARVSPDQAARDAAVALGGWSHGYASVNCRVPDAPATSETSAGLYQGALGGVEQRLERRMALSS